MFKSKKEKEEIAKKKEEEEKKKKEEEEKKIQEKENNIEIAVRFLANPKVHDATDAQKKRFLKQKGLSDAEIEIVYKRFAEEKDKLLKQQQQKNTSNPQANVEIVEGTNQVSPDQTPVVQQQQPQLQTNQIVHVAQNQGKFLEDMNTLIKTAQENGIMVLKQRNIRKLEGRIYELKNLNTLILSHNNLQILPPQIGQFEQLRIFHAVNCNLNDGSFDNNFWELKQLGELILSQNHLTNINQIVSLKNLRILDVSDNQLTNLPQNYLKGNLFEDDLIETYNKNGISGLNQYLENPNNSLKETENQINNINTNNNKEQ